MFLKDFQNKKDELSSISYLKKHEFLIRTFLIFLMGITYFPLSILQELSTFLSFSALMLLLLTFTMSIIGYFYHSRDN